jgi:hypothetical protein
MRYALVALALTLVACGQSPVSPTPNPPPIPVPPPVQFRVLVHGLQTTPLVALPVTLHTADDSREAVTDAAGYVAWPVRPGEPFTLTISANGRRLEYFRNRAIESDALWYVSAPLCEPREPCR